MIGIVIIATNAYFVLGIRFMKRFMHHYKGNRKVKFYFFSDTNPQSYLPDGFPIQFIETHHKSWVDGTNSKFSNILSITPECDYLYYFDADTNITSDFTEDWFLGDLVGGEHYGNNQWMKERKAFDRNPLSKAYVPENTTLPQMYYYGAFFGGSYDQMRAFCDRMKHNQMMDKQINYEPAVNDESYINQYFHFNPPTKVVPCQEFKFVISDKGGIGETRRTSLNTGNLKEEILQCKDKLFNIIDNKIVYG